MITPILLFINSCLIMKRLQLLLFTLLLTGTVSAQKTSVQKEEGDGYVKITKVVPRWNNKHDLRLGVGSYSLAASLFFDGFGYDDMNHDLKQNIIRNTTRRTPERFWGTYSFSYTYHPRRWFQFGGTVSYGFATQSRRDLQTDEVVVNMNRHAVGIMPTFRFIYMYREKVQLYSAISGGLVFGTGISLPWLDATLIGCSFGKNIFGFAEIGAGVCGWGRVGIGYRFDAKKK